MTASREARSYTRLSRLLLGAAFLVGALLPASDVSAAVVCTFGTGTVDVVVANDVVWVRADGGAVQFSTDGSSFSNCGAATTAGTSMVQISGSSGAEAVTIVDGAAFGPGIPDEGDGTSEIEFEVDLEGGADSLTLQGGVGADSYRIGSSGVANLNASGADLDADVVGSGGGSLSLTVEDLRFDLRSGSDVGSAAGGLGTGGAAFATPIRMDGGSGADDLTGGAGNDLLAGQEDNDTITGGVNDAGGDTADFSSSAAGVTANLMTGSSFGAGTGTDVLSTIENAIGSSSSDVLSGDSNANALSGGGGDDTLIGLGNSDALIGGAHGASGDTADYSSAAFAVNVDLGTGSASGVDIGTDGLTTVENAIGSGSNDTLTGDSNQNTLSGGNGDDTLTGLDGNDALNGGGNGGSGDTIVYSTSMSGVTVSLETGGANGSAIGTDVIGTVENVTGSPSNDVLSGDGNSNSLSGGNGDDVLAGRGSDDTLTGGAHASGDTADYSAAPAGVSVNLGTGVSNGAGSGSDSLVTIENVAGSPFDDSLTGSDSVSNSLSGGGGNDTLIDLGGNDSLAGGGNGLVGDTVDYSTSALPVTVDLTAGTSSGVQIGIDSLGTIENGIGTASDDAFTGNASDNSLSGGNGNDTLIGLAGNDTLTGGGHGVSGDTVAYTNSPVTVSLASGAASGPGVGSDTLAGVENLSGSSSNDSLTGDGGPNVIDGGGGDDILAGLGGNDALSGGGHLGNGDTVDYSTSGAGVTVNLVAGSGSGAAVGADSIASVENVTGSALGDVLTGNSTGNALTGLAGDDDLTGDAGDDLLDGGAGDDQLIGGAGTADRATFVGGGAVQADLEAGTATARPGTPSDVGSDTLQTIEDLAGSAFHDVLSGDGSPNLLEGMEGEDVLVGRGGADREAGGAGNDRLEQGSSSDGGDDLSGGAGRDEVVYTARTSSIIVLMNEAFDDGADTSGDGVADEGDRVGLDVEVLATGSGPDRVSGSSLDETLLAGPGNDLFDGSGGADVVLGEDGNDRLLGSAGKDNVSGGRGRDFLSGGGGRDSLSGGPGADVLRACDDRSDRVTGGKAFDRASLDRGRDVRSRIERLRFC